MANRSTTLTFTANRGRYGYTRPLEIPDGGCIEAVNVDFFGCTLGRKRPPLLAVNLTSGPTTAFERLFRYTPGSSDAASQLVALEVGTVAGQNNIKARASGTWYTPAEETAADKNFTYASIGTARGLNGKFFLTGANTVKVLNAAGAIRQMGITPTAKPTVTNTGSGTYAAIVRYYKVAFVEQATGVTIRRAELSPASDAFTPSGSGTAARVARPTVPLGGPTHWEVYGSADGLTYYLLSTVANASTYYDDSAAPSSYSGNPQAPVVGENTVPANWKCLGRDGNRLLGWGSNTTSESQSRLWFTAVLGASNIGDEERVPSNNYLGIGEADGDYATALSDNVDGVIYAFKRRHIYKVLPTGDSTQPYVFREISNCVGAVDPTCVIEGEDAFGRPCLYFTSDFGVYRLGVAGLENLTSNITDLYDRGVYPLVYHGDRRQAWFRSVTWGLTLVYHVETGAWSTFTGAFGNAGCACLYSLTPGSSALIPFVGSDGGAFLRYYYDSGTAGFLDDSATGYVSYVLTAPRAPFGLLKHIETQDPMLLVHAGDCPAVRVTPYGDWVASANTGDVSCVIGGGTPMILNQAEGARTGNCGIIYYKVGDPSSTQQYAWKASALSVDVLEKEGL